MDKKQCCETCEYVFTQSYRNILCEKTMKWNSNLYCCERWTEKKEADKK